MLALMFGPRHAASLNRDSHGHIFLDFDPDSFVQILSYLRSIEHPDRPAPAPVVQPGSQSTFTNLVYYLGLEDFVGLIRFDKASAISMNISKDGHAAKGCITKHVDSQCFAAPAMQRGAVYYLRCTISHFTPSSQMYMGIAQPSESTATSRKYTTSSGWNSTHTIRRGYENDSPPPGWCSGDELVFKFDLADDKGLLSVWSNKSQQLHHIKLSCDCDAEKPYFFHFATTQHNAIRLEPTSEQDQQVFT